MKKDEIYLDVSQRNNEEHHYARPTLYSNQCVTEPTHSDAQYQNYDPTRNVSHDYGKGPEVRYINVDGKDNHYTNREVVYRESMKVNVTNSNHLYAETDTTQEVYDNA